MILENIEIFNAAECEKSDINQGIRFFRYSKKTMENLFGGDVAKWCKSCEIRFVTESTQIKMILYSGAEGEVLVFRGDYAHSIHHLKAGEKSTLKFVAPERFQWVKDGTLGRERYSTDVWRIFINADDITLFELDTSGYEIRAPRTDEVPGKKWLAYGSSITYGECAIQNTNSYIQQAARRLKVDVHNLGLPGACYCEKEAADFIAGRDDWDFCTLEIGVNMRSVFSEGEFEKRAEYMIDAIIKKHPDKPIVIISLFPNHAIYSKNGSPYEKHHIAYCGILEKLFQRKKDEDQNGNIHFIPGDKILLDFTELSCDLIHPSEWGHIRMGERLADLLKDIIA